jgi:hypothetical protein
MKEYRRFSFGFLLVCGYVNDIKCVVHSTTLISEREVIMSTGVREPICGIYTKILVKLRKF